MSATFPVTMFGETRVAPGRIVLNNKRMPDDTRYDDVFWVERPEEEYGLMSCSLRDKPVLVVRRDDWIRSPLL